MSNFSEIKTKFMQQGQKVIDNHTGREITITGLVEFTNPNKGLACCLDARYYSLNKCYLHTDGKLHCSTYSIGGVLCGTPTSKSLKEYNENQLFDGGKIKCVYLPNGRIILPAV